MHEYYRQSDLIQMAHYAQTVNVIGAIKTTKTQAAFEPTGLVLKLYRQHFGVVPVEVSGSVQPLDTACVVGSVRRTGRLVTAHEAWVTAGLGAEVVAAVAEACPEALRAPVVRRSLHSKMSERAQ